jgi:hypothetical protein
MNQRHRKTLATLFSDPVNGNMEWRRIEALLLALGAAKDEGQGSAVTFFLNGITVTRYHLHHFSAGLW